MDTVKSYKCPCCNAPLIFKGSTQKLHCDSCGNDFDTDTVKKAEDADNAFNSENKYDWDNYTPRNFQFSENGEISQYECPSCGATVSGDSSMGSTICPYCGNTMIGKDKFEGNFMPDYIIPFKIDKKSAMQLLHKNAKKKLLIPKEFKKISKLKDITGLYVPFWMFDCKAAADGVFSGNKVTTWSDGRYNYTKTDHYKLYRSGLSDFENIPVDASKKADNAYMDAIEPFDCSEAVKFDESYLLGYFADKYDVSIEDSTERANGRIKKSMEQFLISNTGFYSGVVTENVNVQFGEGKIRYALLPIWMLNIKYKDKMYRFAMNGQTGKSVGKYPVSKWKTVATFGLSFAVSAAIMIFIWYLIGG